MGAALDNVAVSVVAFLCGPEGTEREKQLVEVKGLQAQVEVAKLQATARALMHVAAVSQASPPKPGKRHNLP